MNSINNSRAKVIRKNEKLIQNYVKFCQFILKYVSTQYCSATNLSVDKQVHELFSKTQS